MTGKVNIKPVMEAEVVESVASSITRRSEVKGTGIVSVSPTGEELAAIQVSHADHLLKARGVSNSKSEI